LYNRLLARTAPSTLELAEEDVCKFQLGFLRSIGSLHFNSREFFWEPYHVDCKKVAGLLQNHKRCSNISGALSVLYCPIVFELDIPWNDAQVADYGESFKAWGPAEFKEALAPILQAIPYNRMAIVVTFLLFVFILLGLS